MVVKSLKPVLMLSYKNVLFFCICTDLLYRYCFLIFVLISCISTVLLYFDMIVMSTMLLLDA